MWLRVRAMLGADFMSRRAEERDTEKDERADRAIAKADAAIERRVQLDRLYAEARRVELYLKDRGHK